MLIVMHVRAKSLQLCLSLCIWTVAEKSTRLLCPWDSPNKNTGVGCHALLQGNLPDPGIEPAALTSPALAGRFFIRVPLISDSDRRVPADWGQESQASSWVEAWNSACLSRCPRGERPLVELY